MPIDPSISLRGVMPQFASPMELQQQAVSLRSLMQQQEMQRMQMEQAQRDQADQRALGDLYRRHGTDLQAIESGAASSGLGRLVPGLRKQRLEEERGAADIGKTRAETEKAQFSVTAERAKLVREQVSQLETLGPNLTRDHVIRVIAAFAPPEMHSQMVEVVRSLPPTPEALMAFVRRVGQSADQVLQAETSRRGQDMTQAGAREGHAVTVRGQNMTQQTAREGHGVQLRGQNMTDARGRELAKIQRDANEINREAQQSQVIIDPTLGPIIANKGTKTASRVSLDGKPIPGEETVKESKRAAAFTAQIQMARELLPGATGSGVGSLVDKAGNMVGASTESAEKAKRLATLSGWMTSNVPRMEGPQSNFDVENYKIMAAQVGDATIPVKQRQAALNTLEEVQALLSSGSPEAQQRVSDILKRAAAVGAPKSGGGGGVGGAPAVGFVDGGYRFKGGDPSRRENWERQR